MKKTLLTLSAVTMLIATSCQKDLGFNTTVGEISTVSLDVETPEIGTRAYSDGSTATVLQYAVYDAEGNILSNLTKTDATIDNGSTTVKLQLTTGNSYSVIFWAAAPYAPYTVDFGQVLEDATMTVNYNGAVSNDENRDAFYKYHTFTVTGAQTETIELKRPFAQLNIGTADYDASKSAGYTPTKSSVIVANVYSTLNLASGEVDGAAKRVFDFANINKNETFPVAGNEYLAMNYLLVDADKETVEVEFTYTDDTNNAKTRKIGSVPVQRNYRTNIYGNLLTSDVDINVEIVPEYNEPDLEAVYPPIESYDEFLARLSDDTWYDDTKTELIIEDVTDFAAFVETANSGNDFDGKTIMLAGDIDLYFKDITANADGDPITFRPIGDTKYNGGKPFKGTFDGKGHTIKNLYQNGWDLGYEWGVYGSYGLFGNLEDATVKNLVIEGSESYIEGGDVSFIAGSATGTCVFENITIKNSKIATYNNGCGGIIGWSGAGNYTFKNIVLESDVVLGGLWGSFDSSIGGIVGQAEPGATYNFDNVKINCRLDVYNDVIAAYKYYNYRMCGMIIGRCAKTTTIDGKNYPDLSQYNLSFKNVEVNFGKWMNYHYCVVEGKTAWRVEPGYQYGGVPADHNHDNCTMHHNLYKPFDVLIGGEQYGVYGHRTLENYPEVKVTYPASYNPNH